MSLLAIAWTIVAFLVGALVVVLCVVMANLFRVLTSTKDLIDGVTKETVPLLGQVPIEEALVTAGDSGVPLVLSAPDSRAGRPRRRTSLQMSTRRCDHVCQARVRKRFRRCRSQRRRHQRIAPLPRS